MDNFQNKWQKFNSLALATGHIGLTHINQGNYDTYQLRTSAELLNIKNQGFLSALKLRFQHYDFPLGRKSFTQICHKRPNRGFPDFYVFDNELIIEAKINISENNFKKDTEKYLPYCKKLQIWYLYGIPPSNLSDKIELVGLDEIKPFIKADSELEEAFKSLTREIGDRNVTPKMPKKILVLGSGAIKIGEAGESAKSTAYLTSPVRKH